MPITEQQANEWTGPLTADELIPMPTKRLTFANLRPFIDFSTAVVHCFVYGGSTPPLFWHLVSADGDLQHICRLVLDRDSKKRAACDAAPASERVAMTPANQVAFFRTYGHESDRTGPSHLYPFIIVSRGSPPPAYRDNTYSRPFAAHV